MDLDLNLNKSQLLYIGASILAAGAVISFSTGNSMLSPVTKIVILGLLTGAFILFGTYSPRKLEATLLYGLASFTYIVGTIYTVSKFNLGSDGSFLMLLISAGAFAGLGHLITQKKNPISKKRFQTGAAIIILIGLSITLFDLSGAQPNYSVNLDSQVELTEYGETQVGRLVAQNSFALPRTVEIPRYNACIYTPEKQEARIDIENSYDIEMLSGGEVRELEMTLMPVIRHGEETDEPESLGNFTVERAEECPETSEQNKIVITRQ